MVPAARQSVRAVPIAIVVGFVLGITSPVSAQQNEDERAKSERVSDLLEILGARDGAHIADLGSADGFYTLRIATAVAPSGRAYGVDIEDKSLQRMRERAAKEGVTNLDAVLGTADDPKLPEGRLDAVLIRNAYHEMPAYVSILAAVRRSLKPGGALVVSESISDAARQLTREQQVKEHYIAMEIVERELTDAGFEIVSRDEAFTRFTRSLAGGYWLIRARKP
jgi:ubiquinone/menaquinone biosynthesis C-methylase UbiE